MGTGWQDNLVPGGARLLAFLDGLPVEANWLSGAHVVWQTGQQNGPPGVGVEDHTHCSALVAAIALYLDIYVLRPPAYPQEFLANAQVEWLSGSVFAGAPDAAAAGWRSVGSSGDAGALALAVASANMGKLVIAGYFQPPGTDPVTGQPITRSGHIVVVRPQDPAYDPNTGPTVVSASDRNKREILMLNAFILHQGAWPDGIALFVHDTDLEPEIV